MYKRLLKFVELVVLLVLLGESGKVIVADFAKPDDAHVIHLLKLHAVPNAVSEGEETLPLPAQLLDFLCRFRHLIEETLQLRKLLVGGHPYEVT